MKTKVLHRQAAIRKINNLHQKKTIGWTLTGSQIKNNVKSFELRKVNPDMKNRGG